MKLQTGVAVMALLLSWSHPGRADEQSCTALLAQVAGANLTARSVTAVGADGCDFADVDLRTVARTGWSAAHVILTRLDFPALQPQSLPKTLRLEAHGVRFSARPADPVLAYVVGLNVHPFEVTLDYDGPRSDGSFQLNEFLMTGRVVGTVRLSGVLVNVDPTLANDPDPARAMSAGLKSLSLHLDNQGFFESYIAAPLAGVLLRGSPDPQATVAAMRQTAIDAMRQMLAGTATPAATVDALARFLADLPHPDKVLDLAIDLAKPIGMAEATSLQAGSVTAASLLPAGSLVARYEAAP